MRVGGQVKCTKWITEARYIFASQVPGTMHFQVALQIGFLEYKIWLSLTIQRTILVDNDLFHCGNFQELLMFLILHMKGLLNVAY